MASWGLAIELLVGLSVLGASLAGMVRFVVRPQIAKTVELAMGNVKKDVDRDLRAVHHRITELNDRETVCRAEVLAEVARAERVAENKVEQLSGVVAEIKKDTRMLVTHLLDAKERNA